MHFDKHIHTSTMKIKDKWPLLMGGINSYEKINYSEQLGLKIQLGSRGNIDNPLSVSSAKEICNQ